MEIAMQLSENAHNVASLTCDKSHYYKPINYWIILHQKPREFFGKVWWPSPEFPWVTLCNLSYC